MARISLTHHADADPEAVREIIEDVEPFMAAAGFDEVVVEGDRLELAQALGLARIELALELVDDPDAVLRYDQVDGIFEEMTTRYEVEAANEGTDVTATTEFTLGGVTGTVLDSTLVKRQRRRELTNQFEYLDEEAG